MLLVISIIMLLISITLPALWKSKEHARRILCANQLRQSAIMCVSFSDNNKEKFPDIGSTSLEIYQYNAPLARQQLGPHGLIREIAFCPDGFAPKDTQDAEFDSAGFGWWGYSYFPNRDTRDGFDGSRVPLNKLNNRIPGTGDDWILIADVSAGHNEIGWTPTRPWAWTHANHGNPARPEGRHLYTGQQMYLPFGLNNAYYDTHVRWINFDNLDMTKHYVHSHWKYNHHWD